MKTRESFEKCRPELIGRYIDGELTGEEASRLEGHVRECPACTKELEDISSLSMHFKQFMHDRSLSSDDLLVETNVLNRIRDKEYSLSGRLREFFTWKRIMVPAAGVCVAAAAFLLFFLRPVDLEPTAIVQSVSGDVASIYILETPETRQTILWFNERVDGRAS